MTQPMREFAFGRPKRWAGLPVPAAPYSCGENWTGTESATSGDRPERRLFSGGSRASRNTNSRDVTRRHADQSLTVGRDRQQVHSAGHPLLDQQDKGFAGMPLPKVRLMEAATKRDASVTRFEDHQKPANPLTGRKDGHPARCAPGPMPGGSGFMPRAAWPVSHSAVGAVFRRGVRTKASGFLLWFFSLSAPVRRVVSACRGNPGVRA